MVFDITKIFHIQVTTPPPRSWLGKAPPTHHPSSLDTILGHPHPRSLETLHLEGGREN